MTHSDDIAPATKKDVQEIIQKEMNFEFGCIGKEFTKLRLEIKKEGEETRRHFDVVAEQLFHDLAGASRDEIEILKDARKDHSRRIRRLERTVGIEA